MIASDENYSYKVTKDYTNVKIIRGVCKVRTKLKITRVFHRLIMNY